MCNERTVSDMTDNKTALERLEKELKKQRESNDRMWSYWKEEEMKAKILSKSMCFFLAARAARALPPGGNSFKILKFGLPAGPVA